MDSSWTSLASASKDPHLQSLRLDGFGTLGEASGENVESDRWKLVGLPELFKL